MCSDSLIFLINFDNENLQRGTCINGSNFDINHFHLLKGGRPKGFKNRELN